MINNDEKLFREFILKLRLICYALLWGDNDIFCAALKIQKEGIRNYTCTRLKQQNTRKNQGPTG